jgi:hypothetical protein
MNINIYYLGREELGRDNEGGGVRTPIGKEESEGVHSNPSISHHRLLLR